MELIKVNNQWRVMMDSKASMDCATIETAAETLSICGVPENEIDAAICALFALNHNKACFGLNGNFMFSEKN